MIDLESLKRAAEAVWSRPNWRAAMGHVEADETEDYPRIDINCKAGNQDDAKRLSRFIALANPSTILQLIARLEASERELEIALERATLNAQIAARKE